MCELVFLREWREQLRGRATTVVWPCTLGDIALDLASKVCLALSIMFWVLALMYQLVPLRKLPEQLRGHPTTADQPCTLGDIAIDLA